MSATDDFSNLSIWDLFRLEVESKTASLTADLLSLERGAASATLLEDLMRAAHSLKGAAQMVEARPAVRVAHAMEDTFVSMQKGDVLPTPSRMDLLLEGVDLLQRIANTSSTDAVALQKADEDIDGYVERLSRSDDDAATPPGAAEPTSYTDVTPPAPRAAAPAPPPTPQPAPGPAREDDTVRVTAGRMNRLLSLAAESLVTTRWLDDFIAAGNRERHQQREVAESLERFRDALATGADNASLLERLASAQRHFGEMRRSHTSQAAELGEIQRRSSGVATRLYREVVDLRMLPFGEGVGHLTRLVRSISRQLNKEVRLVIEGGTTPVDREILERLDASIVNLIRNAIDHGIESPEERVRKGKPPVGTIRLAASHRSGMLFIHAEDDGRGVDIEAVRRRVVERRHTTEDMAARMSTAELMEFLLLPGFSMRDTVSEISGRGVGLDIVQTAAREAGGKVTLHSEPNAGLHFVFQLPLTLSVVRALVFEVGGEPYAVPIARVARVLRVPKQDIESIENRQFIDVDGEHIGLVAAQQIFGSGSGTSSDEVAVIGLGRGSHRYGLTVDRLMGERELVVRALHPLLGKVKDIGSAALLPDGTPLLIIDVEDVLHSIDHLITGGRVEPASAARDRTVTRTAKRILVVDDSFTVRELERKLLAGRGYDVDVAVDGVDGWNAVRGGQYDLVVTDVDMPRMDGIELVTRIRQDPRLHLLPIIIVSYKEREEDRLRGMEAGADRYLAKGSYHDESMLNAIIEQIGAPEDA
ncbi:MAG: hybrid sensor histidine kinase/response regulator [Longimicrobiales bacterium]